MANRDSPTIGEIYGPGAEEGEALAAYIDSLIDDTAKVVAEKEGLEKPRLEVHQVDYAVQWAEQMVIYAVEKALKDSEKYYKVTIDQLEAALSEVEAERDRLRNQSAPF